LRNSPRIRSNAPKDLISLLAVALTMIGGVNALEAQRSARMIEEFDRCAPMDNGPAGTTILPRRLWAATSADEVVPKTRFAFGHIASENASTSGREFSGGTISSKAAASKNRAGMIPRAVFYGC